MLEKYAGIRYNIAMETVHGRSAACAEKGVCLWVVTAHRQPI